MVFLSYMYPEIITCLTFFDNLLFQLNPTLSILFESADDCSTKYMALKEMREQHQYIIRNENYASTHLGLAFARSERGGLV